METISIKSAIPKFGTLQDFKKSVKSLETSGYSVIVTKFPSDLMRKAIIDNTEVIVIVKISNKGWIFRYNKEYFSE